jgi:hypothetical protein
VKRARLYAHALRAARPRQLAARVTRVVTSRRFPEPARANLEPLPTEFWRSPAFAHADRVAGDGAVDVLGLAVPFPPLDWTLPGEPRLRRFHLHYGEEVLGWARRGDPARARAAAETWIAANPPRAGDPWHPYVVSQRIGNWVAAVSVDPQVASAGLAESMLVQARYLARNVEDDVLGNHVIANARALALAGRALRDGALLARGLALLRRELPEQILTDGGHYERSPLYHALVLRDLLELRVAAELDSLDEPIERMRRFAAALQRPDGLPAPFNDALLELAPELELPAPEPGTTVFEETGYTVVRDAGTWLAFDAGPPSPRFLPAHAHGDALSFQLWQDGRPVVLDPGTSTYDAGPVRDDERSTHAHATATVGGKEQFEVWGAFRSGPLPTVRLLGPLAGEVSYGGVVHRRSIELGDEVVVADEATAELASRLPIEDGIELDADDWAGGHVAEGLGRRRAIRVAVRRGARQADWRIPRATL